MPPPAIPRRRLQVGALTLQRPAPEQQHRRRREAPPAAAVSGANCPRPAAWDHAARYARHQVARPPGASHGWRARRSGCAADARLCRQLARVGRAMAGRQVGQRRTPVRRHARRGAVAGEATCRAPAAAAGRGTAGKSRAGCRPCPVVVVQQVKRAVAHRWMPRRSSGPRCEVPPPGDPPAGRQDGCRAEPPHGQEARHGPAAHWGQERRGRPTASAQHPGVPARVIAHELAATVRPRPRCHLGCAGDVRGEAPQPARSGVWAPSVRARGAGGRGRRALSLARFTGNRRAAGG